MKKTLKTLVIMILLILISCGKDSDSAKSNNQEKTIEKNVVKQEKNPSKEVTYDITTKKEDIGKTVTVEKGETYYVLEKENISIPYDFEIGKYEVTNKEFVTFLNEYKVLEDGTFNGKPIFDITSKHCQIGYNGKEFFIKPWKDNKGRDIDLSDYPVMLVHWYGAITYCNWLSEKNGLDKVYDETNWTDIKDDEIIKKNGYRLPTRNEWIYAMQGGIKSNGTKFAGSNKLNEVAWYEETSMVDGNSNLSTRKKDGITRGTMPVGLLKPNQLGIYDMIGNVWEWVNTDSYDGKMTLGICWSNSEIAGIWGYIFLDDTRFNHGFRIIKTK